MDYVRQDLILKAYTDLLQREGKIFTTDVTDALMAVPLEDVVLVRHGRWIDKPYAGGRRPTVIRYCSLLKGDTEDVRRTCK